MTEVKGRAGWRQEEIDSLWSEIQRASAEGEPLRGVFEKMGATLGRKPNSVRNFYYMQLRGQAPDELRRAAPFQTFSQDEIHQLLRSVLTARGQGQSVRACVMSLSGGNRQKMLRLQNKYRSVLRKRPDLICEVAQELTAEGIPCAEPLPRTDRTSSAASPAACEDHDMQTLMEAALSLLRRAQDPKGDRMRVQRDMALMQLEEIQQAAKALVLCCKDWCVTNPDDGASSEMAACLSRVENLCG